jgi:hypothetical protein
MQERLSGLKAAAGRGRAAAEEAAQSVQLALPGPAQAEAWAAAARASEAEARLLATQKQLESAQSAADAAQASLQEEIDALTVCARFDVPMHSALVMKSYECFTMCREPMDG